MYRKLYNRSFISLSYLVGKIDLLLYAFAISLTKAAHMLSVKRLSVIIGLIYGGVNIKEKNMTVRVVGTLMMVSGAMVSTLWG